jgi:hypothetical protein
MGIFLGKIYGYDNIAECFCKDHWQSLEGWSFSRKKWLFITPETPQMSENLKLDSNKLMVRMAQKQEYQKSTSNKTQQKESESKDRLKSINKGIKVKTADITTTLDNNSDMVSSELQQAFRQNEINLIKKARDPDLDSIGNDADDDVTNMKNIEVDDIVSTTSSLTTNTGDTYQPKGRQRSQSSPDQTIGLISTVSLLVSLTSSIHSITRDKLESLFEEGMTQQQRKERADQYTFQQIQKVMIEKNEIYESLFPEETKEQVPSTDQKDKPFDNLVILDTSDQESKSNREDNLPTQLCSPISVPTEIPLLRVTKHKQIDISDQADDDPNKFQRENRKGSVKLKGCEVSEDSADKGS